MTITRETVREMLATTGLDIALLVETGSRAYGTAVEGSDTDLVGLYVESRRELLGMRRAPRLKYRVRSFVPVDERGAALGSVLRTSADGSACLQQCGAGDRDDPARPDDVEVLLLPLKEYAALAAAGNPEFLGPLFTDLDGPLAVVADARGRRLAEGLRQELVTTHAAHRVAGYARTQRGIVAGDGRRRTNRHDLVAEHGYDTKAGSHLLRLLLVGHRLVSDGAIELPMRPEEAALVLRVRRGEVALQELLAVCEGSEQELVARIEASGLPEEADMAAVDELVAEAYEATLLAPAFEEGARAQLDELGSYQYHPQSTGLWNPYAA